MHVVHVVEAWFAQLARIWQAARTSLMPFVAPLELSGGELHPSANSKAQVEQMVLRIVFTNVSSQACFTNDNGVSARSEHAVVLPSSRLHTDAGCDLDRGSGGVREVLESSDRRSAQRQEASRLDV